MKRRRYVVRLCHGHDALYATGLCTWVADRKRAFVFEDRGKREGLDDGLRWARSHAKALRKAGKRPPINPSTKAHDAFTQSVHDGLRAVGWTPSAVKPVVVRLKRRYKARSSTIPFVTEP
jgi:hypothetical protein